MQSIKKFIPLGLIALGMIICFQPALPKGCDVPSIPFIPITNTVTAVTYIYEKDDTAIPRPVGAALNKLNTMGILATDFEEDTADGTGEVPEQYKIALEAARKAGLPCLVVQSGNNVVRVVKDPKTLEAVMEAAK